MKLAWKQTLRHKCYKLKSYHLKIAFYHFLEKADKEALRRAEVEMVYQSLICFITLLLKKEQISHFFIRNINLLQNNPMTYIEKCLCLNFFKESRKKNIDSIFCNRSETMILIQELREKHPYLHTMGTIILILANVLGVGVGAAAYCIVILIA